MKTNLKKTFQIFWILYIFILCICSTTNTDPKVQTNQPPTEDNETISHPVPTVLKDKDHPNDKPGGLPDVQDVAPTDSRSKEGDGQNKRSEPQINAEKLSETSEKPKKETQDSESNDTVTSVEGSVTKENGKASSSPVTVKEEAPKVSSNVETPKADIPPSKKESETPDVQSASKREPKMPTVDVNVKKESINKSVASGTSSDTEVKEKDDKGSVSPSGYQPEDGSDVPTFDEYQRTFTEKRDASGVENGNGGRSEEVKNGGTAAKDATGSVDASASQAGKPAVGRFKNVGSTSCGAKVVAHNDEASFPAHVLNENRDEYMNHPCTVKKWFVVEACEPVRLRQIDIASYELFSSMVKTFRVSASERYPQKLWDMVGTFTAKNEKGVQTYRAEQDKYYKYFKFEILDHHGNEHFCPLSLIRLYGVLMEDDDGDDYPGTEPTSEGEAGRPAGAIGGNTDNIVNTKDQENSQSLLGSATKALVDIVKKTLQPRKPSDDGSKSSDSSTTTPKTGDATTTPSPLTESAMGESMTPQEETRLSQLIKLLVSGEYSSLLRRCVELLRETPSAVQRQLILYEYIPSPTMAFAECSKAAAMARLSSQDLRWAYLIFNNASLPWEPEKRAAEFGKMVESVSKSSTEKKVEEDSSQKVKEEDKKTTVVETAVKDEKPASVKETKVEIVKPTTKEEGEKEKLVSEKEKSPPATKDQLPTEGSVKGEDSTKKTEVDVKTVPSEVSTKKPETIEALNISEGAAGVKTGGVADQVKVDTPAKKDDDKEKKSTDKFKVIAEKESKEKDAAVDKEKVKSIKKQEKPQKEVKEEEQANKVADKSQEKKKKKTSDEKDDKQEKKEEKKEPSKVQTITEKGASSEQSSKQEKTSSGKGEAKKSETPQTVPKTKLNNENILGTNGRNMGIKENAYMRLSNKLRAMEINITVSMSYLEELSRSYKKKTDKMSKHMEKALLKLEETAVQAEERDQVQQKRISVLEKQIEELREELKSTVVSMRKENSRVVHGIILQAVTLNVILMIFHAILTIYCSRRRRHSGDGSSSSSDIRHSPTGGLITHSSFEKQNGFPVLSNSDTNLYIVDPPFRLEEHTVKKDGKRKKKRKKTLAANHHDNMNHNGFRDRSASESRIEDLL